MTAIRIRKRSIRGAYALFVLLVLACIVVLSSITLLNFRSFYVAQLESGLREKTSLIAAQLEATGVDIAAPNATLSSLCNTLAAEGVLRLTLITPSGEVLCDSEVALEKLENHLSRVEVQQALHEGFGSSTRPSKSTGRAFLYVARSLRDGKRVRAIVRTAIGLDAIDEQLSTLLGRVRYLELLVVVALGLISYLLYLRVNRPLQRIREGAEKFAQGELNQKLALSGIREIDGITTSLNSMARRLSRLEEVRRDFVANVSHELKTPITLIKGFVETLLDGAINDKDDARRFLQILATQANRLNTIIEDLLILARLESESEKELLMTRPEPIAEVIGSVVDSCSTAAKEKQIEIVVSCDPKLFADLDRGLAEQALINFVDNAVKYSAPHSRIDVAAELRDGSLIVRVCDQGPGIPPEHLPRLFERFYRVDKARSRDMGGTGLGLSIVKHIAEVHGGSVDVRSVVGSGSEFQITFPQQHVCP